MTSFQTISKFRDRLDGLEKTKRGVYKGVREEIKAAFEGASIEQIRNNRDMILMQVMLSSSSFVFLTIVRGFQRPMVTV